MKKLKNILIITGIIVLLLLLLGWGYILLFGTPINNNGNWAFTELPENSTEREVVESQETERIETANQLQPLTTNPVAGYVSYSKVISTSTEETNGSSNEFLRYVERGTGHIYEIELKGGQKERVSAETFGKAVQAVFSPDGQQVVILVETGDTTSNIWLDIESGTTKSISSTAENLLVTNNSIFYTERKTEGSAAYELNPDNLPRLLWEMPFTDIRVFWREGGDVVINRPAAHLKGGAYLVDKNGWSTLIDPKYQLNIEVGTSSKNILYSYFDLELGMTSRSLPNNKPETLLAIPEKCLYVKSAERFLCASSLQLDARDAISKWYRGEISTDDTVWVEGEEDGTSSMVFSPGNITGFNIDVTDISTNSKENILFFKNKIDDTLWMYSITE